MQQLSKYLSIAAGLVLLGSGFLPLMSLDAISVGGFRSELGVQAGYWMAVIGPLVALLGFFPGRFAGRSAWLLITIAGIVAGGTWWQGHKLGAVAIGTWAMLLGVLLAVLARLGKPDRKK